MAVAIMGWCVALQGAEIHEAAELGDLARVKAYVSQDPNQIDLLDAKGQTVLARAIRSGKQEVVEFLLAKGAKEDIYAAAVVGHVDKVAAFLKQDKKLVNARDSDGRAPLHWAAIYGQTKVMELLLAEKMDVNLLDGEGFIKTGFDLSTEELNASKWPLARRPYLLETSAPGRVRRR